MPRAKNISPSKPIPYALYPHKNVRFFIGLKLWSLIGSRKFCIKSHKKLAEIND
jgi:hypothetical protein